MQRKRSEYNELVLKHYRNPQNFGRLTKPTHEAEEINSLCGDEIVVSLKVRKEKIEDVKFETRGCALMTASASLLSKEIKGKTISSVSKLSKMDIEKLLGTKISKNRQQCIKLPIKALQSALN